VFCFCCCCSFCCRCHCRSTNCCCRCCCREARLPAPSVALGGPRITEACPRVLVCKPRAKWVRESKRERKRERERRRDRHTQREKERERERERERVSETRVGRVRQSERGRVRERERVRPPELCCQQAPHTDPEIANKSKYSKTTKQYKPKLK
jgi:hypothetical protein